MSDMKSDWNKWSTVERISAMALIITFVVVFASSIAGALVRDRAAHGGFPDQKHDYPEE